MTGKTHLAVGTAASLLVTQPSTLKELFICIGVAIVGSVISDIDVSPRNPIRHWTGYLV